MSFASTSWLRSPIQQQNSFPNSNNNEESAADVDNNKNSGTGQVNTDILCKEEEKQQEESTFQQEETLPKIEKDETIASTTTPRKTNQMTDNNWIYSHHENDGKSQYDGRDVVGYGNHLPLVKWPHNAKVALNFVINYEEGGENCILHGDNISEKLLSEIGPTKSYVNERNPNMESLYDYGSRAGFWRLYHLFESKKIPATVFAVGMALERNPEVCNAMVNAKPTWEIASHGYRWWDYSQDVREDVEREHIHRTVTIHEKLLGTRPVGFYQGKPNANTRKLLVEEGGFLYDSDAYDDDLPHWTMRYGSPHLIIPYTLSENDMRFVTPHGFANGSEFCQYLKDSLNYLVQEGKNGHPKMMSVGLHCRIVGRPGRAAALAEFIDYAKKFGKDVWICTREDIAKHWYENHYPKGVGSSIEDYVVQHSPKRSGKIETEDDEEETNISSNKKNPDVLEDVDLSLPS